MIVTFDIPDEFGIASITLVASDCARTHVYAQVLKIHNGLVVKIKKTRENYYEAFDANGLEALN